MKINEVRKNIKRKESEYITKKLVKGGGKYSENKKYVLIFENNETGNNRAREMCERIAEIYELGSVKKFLNTYKIQLSNNYRDIYLLLITYLDIYTLLYEIMDKDNFNTSMDEFLNVLYNKEILKKMEDFDYVTKYEIQHKLNILDSYKLIAKSIVDKSSVIKNQNKINIKTEIEKFDKLEKLKEHLRKIFSEVTFKYLKRVFEKIYKKKCSILRRIISEQSTDKIREFVKEKLKRNNNNRFDIENNSNNSNKYNSNISNIKYDKTQKVIKPPLLSKQYLFSLFTPLT